MRGCMILWVLPESIKTWKGLLWMKPVTHRAWAEERPKKAADERAKNWLGLVGWRVAGVGKFSVEFGSTSS